MTPYNYIEYDDTDFFRDFGKVAKGPFPKDEFISEYRLTAQGLDRCAEIDKNLKTYYRDTRIAIDRHSVPGFAIS